MPSCDEEKLDKEDKAFTTYDLVAGGSNGFCLPRIQSLKKEIFFDSYIEIGVLYLFEKITCVVFRQAAKGKIQCLEIISGSKPGTVYSTILHRSTEHRAALTIMRSRILF